ncbi:TetR/AcrR family transcriptional regulator [Cellulomonas sp. Y8]|uniref:TetR/AcrR family transcriptional regulator n=1 Tax=Cellulomonas sp. Y8 TaxID=2591145 RepID=UPI003D74464B
MLDAGRGFTSTAVTFDSVAAASGITRGGIIYHFRSREDLIGAIHLYLAQRWEQQLEAACGKPAADATESERLIAYVRVATTSATRAELLMLLESPHSEHQRVWSDVIERWIPSHDTPTVGAPSSRMLALLAADGLWVNDAIGSNRIPPAERQDAAEQIVSLIHDASGSAR